MNNCTNKPDSLNKKITSATVRKYIDSFDKEQEVPEEALNYVFSSYKSSQNQAEILCKVIMLNHIYSAGLNSNRATDFTKKHHVDVYLMAEKLAEKSDEINRLIFDEASNPWEAVNYIMGLFSDNYCSVYSFVTKYCNWHNPQKFPIADNYSKGVLYYYFDKTYPRESFNDYEMFCKIYKEFQECECVKDLSIKEIDKFLWKYGKDKSIKFD